VAVQPAARPCRSCGNPIKPGDKFCGKCCARVVDEPPVFSPSQKVPGLPVSPPSPQAGKMQSPACSSCGSPVSADEKFCGICGAPVAVAPAPAPEPAPVPAAGNICAGCGAPLSATAKFCGICGAKVQK
jgi:predicted amidophosphoribosyltransferase